MEAMSYSMPIIATKAGDNYQLVEDGINGYLVKTRDFKNIAKKLYNLISSVDLRNKFGTESYNMLNQKYSLERFKSEYIRFISSL